MSDLFTQSFLEWMDRALLIGIFIACVYEAATVYLDRRDRPKPKKKVTRKRIVFTDIDTGKKRVKYG